MSVGLAHVDIDGRWLEVNQHACAILGYPRAALRRRLFLDLAHPADRAAAQRYLSWMISGAPDLETDSELRVSAAVLATLDRDGHRTLSLLGAQKDVIPIADSLDALASVFRANAYELIGDPASAGRILRELPDAHALTLVCSRFPALRLCARSAEAYGTAMTQESAKRAAGLLR